MHQMLFELAKLAFTPFQNRSGKAKVKVLLIYGWLAVVSHSRMKVKLPGLTVRSKVWENYRDYLLFQVRFISPKFWAKTPLILAVTGGYANNFNVGIEVTQRFNKKPMSSLAAAYGKAFTGFSPQAFETWLINYKTLSSYFETEINRELKHVSAIAEIGPGFLPIATSALSESNLKFYSYDTYEMQLLQKVILDMVIGDSIRVRFHPTNLSEDGNKMLTIPTERYCVYAFWSFTEVEIEDRERFRDLIKFASYSIIICNPLFEGTDNFQYLANLSKELGKEAKSITLDKVLGSQIPKFLQRHKMYLLQ